MVGNRFRIFRFIRGAYRNSPWLFIAVGLHVIVFAGMSILYIHHELKPKREIPSTIAVGATRTEIPLAVPPPPEVRDRNKIPEQTDAQVVDRDLATFIPPADEPVEEDPYADIGDPTGTDDAAPGASGGTSIGVGVKGHYSTGRPSTWVSTRPGMNKRGNPPRGSTVGTEKAVLEGLRWLVRHQSEDGSWGPESCRARCSAKTPCIPSDAELQPFWNEGLTGLALLAFLGAGFDHESKNRIRDPAMGKEYVIGEVIKKGLMWLVDGQKEDGSFSPGRPFLYNEALATMALCEAYALSGNRYFKKPAQRGVDFLIAAQKRDPTAPEERWGWRYSSRADLEARLASGEIDQVAYFDEIDQSDISVTGWVIMALKSARLSGLDVSDEAMHGGLRFAKFVSRDDGLVGYFDPARAGETILGPGDEYAYHPGTMSALSMLVRTFVAHDLGDVFLEMAARQIVKDQPRISKDKLSIDYYYWYYATLALNQFDGPDSPRNSGDYWDTWNRSLQEALLDLQDKHDEPGVCSRGGWIVGDRWSRHGYALYNTAINTLTLEVYYRYENAFGVR